MTDMVKTADVVVIGGGVVGCSLAYQLSKLKVGKVVVLEKELLLGTGSTSKAAGGIRQQFSTQINVSMSKLSIGMFEHFEEEMDCAAPFHQKGYLILIADEEIKELYAKNIKMQNELGVKSAFITPQDAKEKVDQLFIDDLISAAFCQEDGFADPNDITQGFAKGARRYGAKIINLAEVTAIKTVNGKIRGVQTTKGFIFTPLVVDAAGPYCHIIGQMAGVDIPARPYRRQVFTSEPFPHIKDPMPMVVDPTKLYMHKESGGILMGLADPDEPSSFNMELDWNYLEKMAEIAINRIPILEQAEISNGWAGLYSITPDHHAILGSVPDLEGFYCACGFSGHGFMHAPAAGLLVAEEIVKGKSETLGISILNISRFAGGNKGLGSEKAVF
ncbi:FAD-binding oxidoreductase [bacterium]|nr:FAD-binding oxidoreductase [bacterium]